MMAETKAKIEKHIAKHRASGGKAEAHEEHAKGKGAESADRGDDDAEKDLKDKPTRRSFGSPEDEAEAMEAKKGGRVKRKHGGKMMGKVEGEHAMHHAGRKARAAGGGCESNPFTSANKGTPAKGRSLQRESEGRDA